MGNFAIDPIRVARYRQVMSGKTLNITDTARYLGYCRKTFYTKRKKGQVPPPIPGTDPEKWYIGDLDLWLRGQHPMQLADC